MDREESHHLKAKEKNTNPYSLKYRIFKTVLMIYAWVSFGINLELIGTALEDLRILLSVDYQRMVTGLVLRSITYMVVSCFIGLVIDKLSRYSELLMSVAKLLLIIPNFLIPWIQTYSLSMALFSLQGVGHAVYDVCGNQIIFKLWSGISESPVNAMHAGYGIGAMITVQLLKPFLKYEAPQETSPLARNATDNFTFTNETYTVSKITADDIQLQVPYSIAGSIGILTMIIFVIAQLIESRYIKKYEAAKKPEDMPLKNFNETKQETKMTVSERIFGRQIETRKHLMIMSVALGIFCVLFMSIQFYNFTLTSFLVTYATKGPAKFARDEFLTILTLFWVLFIIGRFSAALFGFKLNALYFFSALVYVNGFMVFLYNTKLNMMKSFYWFIILALGFTNGPLVPCCFGAAKYVFVKTSALLLSIFCISLGIGSLGAFYITGYLLDTYKPSNTWLGYKDADSSYIIPLIMLVICLVSAVFIIFALALHLIYKDVFHGRKTQKN